MWHPGVTPNVILSEAKEPKRRHGLLRFAQDDKFPAASRTRDSTHRAMPEWGNSPSSV